METAENDDRAVSAKPVGELIGAFGESEMNGNGDNVRQLFNRDRASKEVFIPVLHTPMRRRGSGDTGEREGWGEDVFPKTCVGIFGIERVDEKNRMRCQGPRTLRQGRGVPHFF